MGRLGPPLFCSSHASWHRFAWIPCTGWVMASTPLESGPFDCATVLLGVTSIVVLKWPHFACRCRPTLSSTPLHSPHSIPVYFTGSTPSAMSDSSRRSPKGAASRPPSAAAQYEAASLAARAATAQNRPPPQPPKPAPAHTRQTFADMRWAWSRQLHPPNSLTRSDWEDLVLKSPRVQDVIDKLTAGDVNGGGINATTLYENAQAMFESMYADINPTNVRGSIYLMRKVWRTMYEGIRVNEDGIQMLKEYSKAKVPVVLLPMHKSHVDYLLLSYVCVAYNLFPPHIIAGRDTHTRATIRLAIMFLPSDICMSPFLCVCLEVLILILLSPALFFVTAAASSFVAPLVRIISTRQSSLSTYRLYWRMVTGSSASSKARAVAWASSRRRGSASYRCWST